MIGVINDALFLTGRQRSGTTLLEKLLASQERLSVLSQPFPLLFVEAGRAFLRSCGIEHERYPLGHISDSTRFGEFLRHWRPSRDQLAAWFAQMNDYSGQYTRFTPEQVDGALSQIADDDDFAAVLATFDRSLAVNGGARWFGSKESFCDEFVPPLLDRGFRCVIIIRDPRDVVASLNHGRGRDFAGDIKPTLFNVRNWRKSVGIALAMEGRPRFHCCRYEELAADPTAALSRLGAALDIDIDPRQCELRDWQGNSSFGEHRGVSSASVGSYRRLLTDDVASFIEATCRPELRLLGYDTTLTTAEAIRVIDGFREPYTTRSGMEADAATPANAAIETERLTRVSEAFRE